MAIKILLQFGNKYLKSVSWDKTLSEFPQMVSYKDTVWEWICYDKDPTGKYEYVTTWGEAVTQLSAYGYSLPISNIDLMFPDEFKVISKCECGAGFSSFKQVHSFWCPKWAKCGE